MPRYEVSRIMIYPVKSTRGVVQTEAAVLKEGLEHDRRWAVINDRNEVLTAREYPALFGITTELTPDNLLVTVPGIPPVALQLHPGEGTGITARLFGDDVFGTTAGSVANGILSQYLGTECRLICMDGGRPRTMNPKYGGEITDPVSWADSAPFLVVSEATLEELNQRIHEPLSMDRFRPNLVISGCDAGEEDGWERILIGDVILERSEACKRCVVTTLDPVTGTPHRLQEPLRTLSSYRRHPRGGVRFGINMIPRILGTIRQHDRVEVL